MSNDPQNENNDDNQFEEYRDQFADDENGGGERPPSNRPFLIAIAVIGGLFLLAVIGLVVFYFLNSGRSNTAIQDETAKINAQNTAIAIQATDIYRNEIAKWTEEAANASPSPTATSLIAVASATPEPTQSGIKAVGDSAARTATVAAFLTEIANTTGTPDSGAAAATAAAATAGTLAPTSTALPNTGVMDDIGLPGMFGAALLLIVVLFLVRRLRLSSGQS